MAQMRFRQMNEIFFVKCPRNLAIFSLVCALGHSMERETNVYHIDREYNKAIRTTLRGGGPSESTLNAKKREGGDREDQRIKKIVEENPLLEIPLNNHMTVYFMGLGSEIAMQVRVFRSGVMQGMVREIERVFDDLNLKLGEAPELVGFDGLPMSQEVLEKISAREIVTKRKVLEGFIGSLGSNGIAITTLSLETLGLRAAKGILETGTKNIINGLIEFSKKGAGIGTEVFLETLQDITNTLSAKSLSSTALKECSEKLYSCCGEILNSIPKSQLSEELCASLTSQSIQPSHLKNNVLCQETYLVSNGTQNIVNWKQIGIDVGVSIAGYVGGRGVEFGLQKGIELFNVGKENAELASRIVIQGGATLNYGVLTYLVSTGAVVCPPLAMVALSGYVIGRAIDIPLGVYNKYCEKKENDAFVEGAFTRRGELIELYKTAMKQSYREFLAPKINDGDKHYAFYQQGCEKGKTLIEQLMIHPEAVLIDGNFEVIKKELDQTVDTKAKEIYEHPLKALKLI